MVVVPNHTTNKQIQHDDGELSMETDEFPFPTSQSVNDTFREATLVATLAERFSLTHFKGFQKMSSQQHLEGHGSIVLQPTGSGKSLCFHIPPIYKQLSSAQQ